MSGESNMIGVVLTIGAVIVTMVATVMVLDGGASVLFENNTTSAYNNVVTTGNVLNISNMLLSSGVVILTAMCIISMILLVFAGKGL